MLISELRRGVVAYRTQEGRDVIYRVARKLVEDAWPNPVDVADGLGVLLSIWNNSFYRYGPFSYDDLEDCIDSNAATLNKFRQKALVRSCIDDDYDQLGELLESFSRALVAMPKKKKNKPRRTPVGVAKALHLIAPLYFPLWDNKIANALGCSYLHEPIEAYLRFMRQTKAEAVPLYKSKFVKRYGKDGVLKLLDEYNYARYTKEWIR